MAEITGASLIGFTVKANVVASVKAPSETVKVKFTTPLRFAAGAIKAEHAGADPLNVIPTNGTIVAEVVAAVIEETQSNVVSISLIVKLTETDPSSLTD